MLGGACKDRGDAILPRWVEASGRCRNRASLPNFRRILARAWSVAWIGRKIVGPGQADSLWSLCLSIEMVFCRLQIVLEDGDSREFSFEAFFGGFMTTLLSIRTKSS